MENLENGEKWEIFGYIGLDREVSGKWIEDIFILGNIGIYWEILEYIGICRKVFGYIGK